MTKRLLSASAVLLAAASLSAQGFGGPGGHGLGGPFSGMRNPVTNAPYSASFTDTSSETLQDGSVLNHTDTRTVARDSLGRTREEITHPAQGSRAAHTSVVIFDPVARTVTDLRNDTKTAVVRTLPTPNAAAAQRRQPPPPDAASASATDQPHERRDSKNVTTTDLGSRTFGTVVATGKKTVRTIPAGTIGNATALVSTHEEWFAPDLKIEVSRNDSDPFHGTHTMTASTLVTTEPDASLFKVPSDYTVTQAPEHARRGFGPRGPQPPAPPADGAAPAPGM